MSVDLKEKYTTDLRRAKMRLGAHMEQRDIINAAIDSTENSWMRDKYLAERQRNKKAIEREEQFVKGLEQEIAKLSKAVKK